MADGKKNNLQKELEVALAKQEKFPSFIIPIIMEGNRLTSIPKILPSINSELLFFHRLQITDYSDP